MKQYENIEKSTKVLKELNGLKWPIMSPKYLHIDFANDNTVNKMMKK